MIEVRNVVKTYGNLKAVDNISFSLEKGKIFGLLGPNGAGKSTTIRMIMNIIKPDSGEIFFDGRKMVESDKDLIGYMPEERGLYKKVRVDELLTFLAEIKGFPASKAKASMELYLERFGLSDWKKSMTDELSKGMSQKVQFISTVLHDPQIIILDEPFSGLDPLSADQMAAMIIELREQGKTIIFSTHIMAHAERICNNLCILKEGSIKVLGGLGEVKKRYGSNTIIIDYDGNAGFIKELPFVDKLVEWPGSCEVSLNDDPEAEQLLLKSVAERLKVRRFEVQSPSLHKIFVDIAGETDTKNE